MFKAALVCVLISILCLNVTAQTKSSFTDSVTNQTDIYDVIAKLRKKKREPVEDVKKLQIALIPSVGYNPSTGADFALALSGAKYTGNPATTNLSVGGVTAYVATKGLASVEVKHSIFLPDNEWNLQGNWQLARAVSFDYGTGTGRRMQDGSFSLIGLPIENNATAFPLIYNYLRLREKLYRKLTGKFYAGLGMAINRYRRIDDERRDSSNIRTHHYSYSRRNDFNPNKYSANGVSVNFQYDSRDQPNRPYRGMYADAGLKYNTRLMGSTHDAWQLRTEFRKYFSLSKQNPEHVLAFWHWGSYLMRGSIPYLELPGTEGDTYGRSGRAYTMGRFKGLSFCYAETEYRFPITANKLISGVLFVNTETASAETATMPTLLRHQKTGLFTYWENGAGTGLRFLFNKYTRSTLCIDYGIGNYGSSGVFVGLNEVF
ncbi:hypothetical protein GCM10027037_15530 [Mucilaginibacter koreensis]